MEDSDGEGAKKKQRSCKHPGCLKHPRIKGFCILHARQELEESVVVAYYKRKRDAPSYYCKHTNCKKRRLFQGYCQVHAKEILGEDVIPDSRTIVTNYCKFSGCSKRCSFKGFCMEHARVELDQEVVEAPAQEEREIR